jgi:hypothetical protein
MCQGLVPPVNTACWWYFTLYQLGVTEPFLFEFMGQQWVEPQFFWPVLQALYPPQASTGIVENAVRP